jgi:hypothetical protein
LHDARFIYFATSRTLLHIFARRTVVLPGLVKILSHFGLLLSSIENMFDEILMLNTIKSNTHNYKITLNKVLKPLEFTTSCGKSVGNGGLLCAA